MKVTGIMTDNGSCYRAKALAKACRKLGLKPIFTRPYSPETNGKVELLVQTALREWVYARVYDTSGQRANDLPIWLHHYNWHRPQGSLQDKPPISRGLLEDDQLRFHNQPESAQMFSVPACRGVARERVKARSSATHRQVYRRACCKNFKVS
jgi:hypothetical protein